MSEAAETVRVETCASARLPRWMARRGQSLCEPERNPFLQWRPAENVAIDLHHFADVVLDADTMMVLKDGLLIRRTNYLRSPDEVAALRAEPSRTVIVEESRPVLMCGDAWSANHYHWLNHTLPTIAAGIARLGIQGVCLAMRTPTPVQEDMLRRLGFGEAARLILEPGRQYALPRALFCDYAVGAADFAVSAHTQAIADRLSATVARAAASGPRIYVSRLAATHRRLVNEAALVEQLVRRGFAVIDPARMDFAEQVRAFREASLVVAPHGAGLANTAFCRSRARVYELMPRGYQNACMVTLAVRRGGAIWVDAFDSPGDGPAFLQDWSVEVDAVLRRLDEIENGRLLRWWRLRRAER